MVLDQVGVIRRLCLSIACLDLTCLDIAWLFLLARFGMTRQMSPPSVPAPRQVVRVADIPMEELLRKFPVDPHPAANPLSPAGLAMSGRAAPPFRGAMALGKIAAQRDIALSRLFLTFGTDTAHCSLAAQASKTTGWPALQSWTDALSTKSASTLVARSLALARYAEFCQQHDVPLLPFDEVLVYKFLLSHAPSSPSTAATLWTAIRFAIHMLGCARSEDLVHSKRICGLVERKMVDRPPRSQEPPLTVAAIARLETVATKGSCRDVHSCHPSQGSLERLQSHHQHHSRFPLRDT